MDFLRDSKNTVHGLSSGQHEKLAKTVKKLQRNKEKRTIGIRAHKCLGSFQAYSFRCVQGLSSTLWPRGLQHTRLSCSSLPSEVHSCPLSQWCHPTISPSVASLLLLPSIFLSIRVFSNELALRIRWLKSWSSVSTPVLPMNIQDWFPLGLTGLIF